VIKMADDNGRKEARCCSDNCGSFGSFALGLGLGLAAGVLAGVMLAPKPGEQTRADIAEAAKKAAGKVKTKVEELLKKGEGGQEPKTVLQENEAEGTEVPPISEGE